MKKYEFASVAKGTLPVGDRWKLIKQLRNKDVYSRESAEYIATALTAEATAAAGGGGPAANAFDLDALFNALNDLPADAAVTVVVEDPVMAALAEQMAGTGMGTPGWGGQRKSRKSRKNRKSRKSRK
jgi:hypothetical protein